MSAKRLKDHMPQTIHKGLPVRAFATVQDFEARMSSEAATSKGFWLKLSKAGAPTVTNGKDDAIEAALCCGWIDGQLDKFDEHYFLVRLTPRRPGSRWSEKNRSTAMRLAKLGRIKDAGQKEIETAKADGRWNSAYKSQSKAEAPADLSTALALNKTAKRFFEALDSANRYSIIYRVNAAKRPETRKMRIAEFVDMLASGKTIHPVKKKP